MPPERYIGRLDLFLGTLPSTFCRDAVAEYIAINIPGEYRLRRQCWCFSTGIPCPGELYHNHFTITDEDCARLLPIPDPVEPGEPRAKVFTYLHRGSGERRQVLTLDNSFNKLGAIVIYNAGDKDLILLDLFPPIEFDSFAIFPVDFVPYTVVRPGHDYFISFEGIVLDPDKMWQNGRVQAVLVLQTNDPEAPLAPSGVEFQLFRTESAIPDWYEFVTDPPPNGGTPACADLNGDGMIDVADTLAILLGEDLP